MIGKKLVIAADFVVISNKQLMIAWVWLSSLVLAMPLGIPTVFVLFAHLTMLFMVGISMTYFAMKIYSDCEDCGDSILPTSILALSKIRFRYLMVFYLVSLSCPVIGRFLSVFVVVKLMFPLAFWTYLIHPQTKCKQKLKDRLTNLVAKVKERLAPQPMPQPQFEPTPS